MIVHKFFTSITDQCLQILLMKRTFSGRRSSVEDDHQRKTKYEIWIFQQPLFIFYSNFKLSFIWQKKSLEMLQMKTTLNGRPQNIAIGISQQPLASLYSIFKLSNQPIFQSINLPFPIYYILIYPVVGLNLYHLSFYYKTLYKH